MLRHPAGDDRVVVRRVLEGPGGEEPPLGEGRAAPGDCLSESVVLVGMRDDCREGVILGRGPHQARAADVDQFDRLRRSAAWFRDDALEGVEVDDHGVEPLDAVGGEHVEVVGAIGAGQDACEDVRMKRLHAAVEYLGKTGDRRDIFDVEAVGGEGRRRPAGAGDADACSPQGGGQTIEAGFIEDTHEHPPHGHSVDRGAGGRRG